MEAQPSLPRAPQPERGTAAGPARPCGRGGPDSADRSIHPGRDIRLGLLGPAALGRGPGRSREGDADRSGMGRVGGGGGGEPGRAGPGRPRRHGGVLGEPKTHPLGEPKTGTTHVTAWMPHRFTTTPGPFTGNAFGARYRDGSSDPRNPACSCCCVSPYVRP
jgi:hypothetical protein